MIEEIKNRRSIRKYDSKPVEEEKLLQLLESARLAPSGSNTQPWHFIVIRSESVKKRLVEAAHNQTWMTGAPVFIVCVADIRSRIEESIPVSLDENSAMFELKQIIRDTAIAAEHIVLEAGRLGLGACWIAWFKQADIRPILNIPSDKFVVSIITVGYSEEQPKARPRKKLEEIVHYEVW